MNAWELPKVLEERLKEKYGDDWEKYVKAKAINEEELEEQAKDKAKEQQKIQREKTLSGFLKKVGLKKCDMLQSTMLFDGVKEADALFQAERKIGDWIFSSAVFFFCSSFYRSHYYYMLIALKRKSALFGNLFKRYTKFCHSPKSRQEYSRQSSACETIGSILCQ